MAKISMAKGGKTVNGKFVANSSSKSSTKSTPTKSTGPFSSTNLTREQQIQESLALAKKISGGIKDSYAGYSEADKQKVGNALTKASTILPKASVPTTPAQIVKSETPYTAPTTAPSLGGVTDAMGGMASLASINAANMKEAERRAAEEKTRAKENKTLLEKFMGSVQSPSEAREQAQKETGMDVSDHFKQQEAGIKEIETLNKEYQNVVAAKDQQIAQSNDKMASMNFINNQTAQIERNAAPQLNRISANINAKAATLQAQQGNFADAQAYVNQAVQDATADTKFKFDMYQTMYQQNEDSFARIDNIYHEAFVTSMNLAKAAHDENVAEKERIGELLLKYPGAGIRMDDSLDLAYKKAGMVTPVGGGEDLTADMKNYNAAVKTGYKGSFADFLGKGGSTSKIDGLATSLFLGEIAIGDVPSEVRNDVLDKYHEMQALAQPDTAVPVANQPYSLRNLAVDTYNFLNPAVKATQNAASSFWGNLFGD